MNVDQQDHGDTTPEPMPRTEWEAHVARVTTEMREYTKKFVTPISRATDDKHGEPHGTGNYIELHAQKFLITNEHVARAIERHSLRAPSLRRIRHDN